MDSFQSKLERLINEFSMENDSNTPDFILAKYLVACLAAFNAASVEREQWYGHAHKPGGVSTPIGAGEVERAEEVDRG